MNDSESNDEISASRMILVLLGVLYDSIYFNKRISPRRDLNNFIIRFYIFIPLFWGLYKMTML